MLRNILRQGRQRWARAGRYRRDGLKLVEPGLPLRRGGCERAEVVRFAPRDRLNLHVSAADQPRNGSEVKFDAYRMAARIEKVKVNLLTQSGLDWTVKYSATSTAALPTRSRRFRAMECWANLADRRGAFGK